MRVSGGISSGVSQYLTFTIAGEEYAISTFSVREIIEYDTVTRIPRVPACIKGVINLRGTVTPVIDLAIKFGMPETDISRKTCIIILEVEIEDEPRPMGIIADGVNEVIDFGPNDIEEPPQFGARISVDFLLGMAKIGRKFALILDIGRALSERELLCVSAAQEELDQERLDEVPASGESPAENVGMGGDAIQGAPGVMVD